VLPERVPCQTYPKRSPLAGDHRLANGSSS
jgi:hypothetical protein